MSLETEKKYTKKKHPISREVLFLFLQVTTTTLYKLPKIKQVLYVGTKINETTSKIGRTFLSQMSICELFLLNCILSPTIRNRITVDNRNYVHQTKLQYFISVKLIFHRKPLCKNASLGTDFFVCQTSNRNYFLFLLYELNKSRSIPFPWKYPNLNSSYSSISFSISSNSPPPTSHSSRQNRHQC